MTDPLHLYDDLADWFHLLTAPADYAEEAVAYRAIVEDAAERPVREVLELGCGGGNNASHLKAHWDLTLTDRSEPMLRQSRRINPGIRHVRGDMRGLRLDRDFDAVFVHDACSYLLTVEDVDAVAATCAAHLRPGGVALLVPDHTAETYRPSTRHGGHDTADGGRGLRYLEWSRDPDPSDGLVAADMVYVLREGDAIRTVSERHVVNAFPRSAWIAAIEDAGLSAEVREVSLEDGPESLLAFLGIHSGIPS